MTRLVIQNEGAPERILELRPGPHRVGRSPENEVVLLHPSVSSLHCLVEVCEEGLLVRDLGSTNGTELDGELILEAFAQNGQVIAVGVFNCRVEGLVAQVHIPQWSEPAPPSRLPPGVQPCSNHPEFPASMKCSHCHKLFCGACIHLMRRQGGTLHRFCPVCSHHCVPIEGMNTAEAQTRLLGFLRKMVPKTGTLFLRHRGRRR
jgi:hypothetical protein